MQPLKVKIARIDLDLPLPALGTPGAAAWDLVSRIDLEIHPGDSARIPLNVIVKTPPEMVLLLFPRSSLFSKKGLIVTNSVGVGDSDYSGANDEYQLAVYNMSADTCKIKRGERVAQLMIIERPHIEWEETTADETSRGGFGSSGGYSES